MYSKKDRIKAIELWLDYEKSTATVIRELGYPSKRMMAVWYQDYLQEQETGIFHERRRSTPKYTEQQQQAAVTPVAIPTRELGFRWENQTIGGEHMRTRYAEEQIIGIHKSHEK